MRQRPEPHRLGRLPRQKAQQDVIAEQTNGFQGVGEMAVGLVAQGLSFYETLRKSLGHTGTAQNGSSNGRSDEGWGPAQT
jgi:hypothetical protein